MSLEDGSNLSRWRGGFFDRSNPDSVSLLYRLMWLFAMCAAEGIYVGLNEAGRPRGVESDIDAGRADDESKTASGLSTMFFQWGRYLLWVATGGRRGTPSAANPFSQTSMHTKGLAADLDCGNYARLYQLAAIVGLVRTIASEKWHLDTVRNPAGWVDFSPYTAAVNAVFDWAPPKPIAPPTTLVVTRRR